MLVLACKCVNELAPSYLSSRLTERISSYCLRGAKKLDLPKPRTSTHGLDSFSYFASRKWNLLPDIARTAFNVNNFNYYIDRSVLLENTPLVKFIRNYIRDPSGVFSISSPVSILMTSFPALSQSFVRTVGEKWRAIDLSI